MRILHIQAGTISGGVTSLVLELARFQKSHGHEVDVYSFRNDPAFFDESGKFESIGINVIKAPSKNRYSLKIIFDLKKRVSKYDLVHVHLFPQQLYVAIARKLIGVKNSPVVITTEHSTWNNRRKYHLLRLIDKWFYKKYDKIICISPQTEAALKDWLKDEELNTRILTINNGIDTTKYNNITIKDPSEFIFQKNQKTIVMVSRMEEPKDPLTLVNAMALCPSNYHCLFAGPGKLISEIESLAERLNIAERIHCLGNRNDIPSILKVANVGVLSTNWEGFGLVAIEYMASGVPCLATDVEGLRDVIGDNDLLFPKGDSMVLAKKIQQLVEDSKYSETKIDFGLHRSELYSADSMNRNYLNMYKELTKQK